MQIQQKKLKFLIELKESKAARLDAGLVLICGKKMVHEISKITPLEILIVQSEALAKDFKYKELLVANEKELKKITGLLAPEPIAAVVKMPSLADLSKAKKLLILESINDPGNVGTLIRTAAALNFDAAIFTGQSADPFNDKALRAAKGASFLLPLSSMKKENLISFLSEKKLLTFVADVIGTPIDQVQKASSFALIMGNESHGPSQELKEFGTSITIPISKNVDSLNVATAGAILMFALGGSYRG